MRSGITNSMPSRSLPTPAYQEETRAVPKSELYRQTHSVKSREHGEGWTEGLVRGEGTKMAARSRYLRRTRLKGKREKVRLYREQLRDMQIHQSTAKHGRAEPSQIFTMGESPRPHQVGISARGCTGPEIITCYGMCETR